MSVTAGALVAPAAGRARVLLRIGLALGAVALAAGAMALLAWLLSSGAPPPPPRRNPFGMGVREAAPSPAGLGATILAMQASFFQSLRAALQALKDSGAAVWPLMALGFAYGVFHAAGPGHGKAVIAAYLVANERAALKGFAMSLAAALAQALVAIALVAGLSLLLQATAATMSRVTSLVEAASFAAVAALGLVLTWRKAGKLAGVAALAADPRSAPPAEACGHAHLPPPDDIDRMTRWREVAGVVLAAGLRPCAGAIVVLVFALSLGLFAAGVAATFAMAAGTALTTGLIAALAVLAKSAALRIAGGRGAISALAFAAIELLAAAFVLVLGASLLIGLWGAASAS
jgi:nickel/cobalt exporter